MKKYQLAILTAALLCGCATANHPTRIAVLQNPETRQTVECRVDPWGSLNYGKQVDDCIRTYEKAGYKLLADSAEQP